MERASKDYGVSHPAIEVLYQHTLNLIVEARDYAAATLAQSESGDADVLSLAVEAERFRVTARLLEVMGWLMVQKAVAAGEITPAEAASDRFVLGNVAVCLGRSTFGRAVPDLLDSLLARSLALYLQAAQMALEDVEDPSGS